MTLLSLGELKCFLFIQLLIYPPIVYPFAYVLGHKKAR